MNKQELMENYTMDQLAEMVIELKDFSKPKTEQCEISGDGGVLKVKCDKLGEEFIAFLDDKYLLCTKAKFFKTQDENEKLNRDVERLQSEVGKYRKAFEDAKKERDCKIVENQNRTEKYKTELERAKNTINQIDDILEELFGVRHDTVDKPDEFEKILSERIKGNVTDFLPTEPIKVAEMLINAEVEYENSPIAKVLYKEDKGTCRIFDIGELGQIAEHLLVYCNHNWRQENEE